MNSTGRVINGPHYQPSSTVVFFSQIEHCCIVNTGSKNVTETALVRLSSALRLVDNMPVIVAERKVTEQTNIVLIERFVFDLTLPRKNRHSTTWLVSTAPRDQRAVCSRRICYVGERAVHVSTAEGRYCTKHFSADSTLFWCKKTDSIHPV